MQAMYSSFIAAGCGRGEEEVSMKPTEKSGQNWVFPPPGPLCWCCRVKAVCTQGVLQGPLGH